jgi:Bacterial PH domain
MTYGTAPTSTSIKVVTAVVLALIPIFLTLFHMSTVFLLPAALVAVISVACYLRTPVAYDVSPSGLTILFRRGSKSFGPVTLASPVERSLDWSIRLWGNGGLFAGTGIFWNRTWGVFRAYITTSNTGNLVLMETQNGKVLISPDNATEAIKSAIGS